MLRVAWRRYRAVASMASPLTPLQLDAIDARGHRLRFTDAVDAGATHADQTQVK